MTEEEYTEVEIEARRRMAWHSRGTRGQVVRPQDMLDWWIAQVAYERGREAELYEPE